MFQLQSGFVSITGDFRDNNEDRGYVDPESRFFLVADGMGGQSAGEKASGIAVEVIPRELTGSLDFSADAPLEQIVEHIDRAIASANQEIMAFGQAQTNCRNMGTTVVFLVQVGENLYVGGVGDSRAYLQRGPHFEQLTTDHSLTQALLDAGTISAEEATTHRYRNVLYRYLGTKEGGTGTNARQLEPQSGDRFLLCSDGVTEGLTDLELDELLREHADPQQAAEAVVTAAQAGGSRDNITCLIVQVS